MIQEMFVINKLKYVELCKTVRKCNQEEMHQFNMKLVQKMLEEGKRAKCKLVNKQIFGLK